VYALDISSAGVSAMHAESQERFRIFDFSPKPAWAEVWHLRKIVIPRRSITGRLLTGQAWRRYNVYKKFTEPSD
jgi:hypothetical protein